MREKIIWILLFSFLQGGLLFGQTDSVRYTSAADFFRQGKVSGSTRTYFMATDNQGSLKDFHALATGGGIRYQTPHYKGFSAAMSGYVITSIFSSDFTQLDAATKNPSRYELGLFDVTNPSEKYSLTRLEEFWLQFERKKASIKIGRYEPENVFINGQDGRMRPTFVQGIQLKSQFGNNELDIQLITRMSPRSTVKWYSIEETFGIYPEGRNPDGTPSGYFQNTKTPGIVVAQLTNKSIKNAAVLAGSIIVANIFQTYYVNPEFSNKSFFAGLMLVGQHPLGNGGNDLRTNKYANEADKSLVISTQLGKKIKKHSVDLNFTSVRSSGRFLMPREWGREPFYTFMPRERIEGAGNVTAVSTNIKIVVNPQFKVLAAYGKFFLPDAANAAQNKYALPSYNQFNLLLNYAFRNTLKGFIIRGLYVRKDLMDKQIENPKLIYNKANLSLYHLILDFTF